MAETFDNNLTSLEQELEANDPWQIDGNPFEQQRHAHMLRLCLSKGAVGHALEIGCAAGAFTAKLAPHCAQLMVIDILPRAISRAKQRVAQWSHIAWQVSDVRTFNSTGQFDLIVAAEVLYYLRDAVQIRDVIDKLTRMLSPDGRLVFGSACDAACRRWAHPAGAETMLDILHETLIETERVHCRGATADEDCLIASFCTPASLRE
ncbi:SAM-dependent methyltransferase [Bradyrhizobium sp. DOA9]|uniref:SAM-dependent methyltransferase n=1 Tax=Bradyrhizobium sp. DOA9 TaxID=1126627 RepID=UPI00046A28C6|nr:SAM-dependent methyltransferase [Bradyrhizobium sp. DOA9]GAJ37735.1 nodulation protein S [Bradyrhizobium sp. DOA9]